MTPKRRIFVREYLVDLNATQAAIRAGFARRSARQYGSHLLRRPDVAQAVARELAVREQRNLVTADRIVKELARISFANMLNYAHWGPGEMSLRPDHEISDDDAAAIAELVPGGKGQGPRVKLHGKLAPLRALAQHLGLFEARHYVDPKAQHEEAARVTESLRRRLDELAKK